MKKLVPLCLSFAAASAFFFLSEKAEAGEVALGADVGIAVPFDGNLKVGPGIDGFLGYRLHFGPLFLQPELIGGYRGFGGDASFGRIGAGAKFGIGGLIQPSVYAHVNGAFGNTSGFLFDGGGALDLKVSIVFLGAHAGLGFLSTSARPNDNTFNYLDLGLHFGLLL